MLKPFMLREQIVNVVIAKKKKSQRSQTQKVRGGRGMGREGDRFWVRGGR